ncbi:hypothetical protein JW992_05745 [candidate division KSB1 bacterium]|nr:hypothetical protein [candidate division KSB1 bacterium]
MRKLFFSSRRVCRLAVTAICALCAGGCAVQKIRFADRDPVWFVNDMRPIPAPRSVALYCSDTPLELFSEPVAVRKVPLSRDRSARDVNSLDQVPESSWFAPRLGRQNLTPQALTDGPVEDGPPQPPLRALCLCRSAHLPTLLIQDQRGLCYWLKFDPPDSVGIRTATSFIVGRLFWAFGYHVPEEHLFAFSPNEIQIDPAADFHQSDLDSVFARIASPLHGHYRTAAVRIPDGLLLGPTLERGVRHDDPNDIHPREDRRVLRAFRVFAAFVNMPDISSRNTLDLYAGPDGEGAIKHYFVEFDDALGAYAARTGRFWAGHRRLFDIGDLMVAFFTAAFRVDAWEDMVPSPWPSVGVFESGRFNPFKWKEIHSYAPIRHCQPSDAYWAAKIVAALTPEHISCLVDAADYPHPGAAEYVKRVLLDRRRKIIDAFFLALSPIEFIEGHEERLYFLDYARLMQVDGADSCRYRIAVHDEKGRPLQEPIFVVSDSARFSVLCPPTGIERTDGYFCLEIGVERFKKTAAMRKPAQFHFRRHKGKNTIIGIVH